MGYLAKAAMVLSLFYYVATFGYLWIGQILGAHNEVWDAFDFPIQNTSPPMWSLLVGTFVTGFALFALGYAYSALWKILSGGDGQDFRDLGRRLRRVAKGLFGFWFGYNVLTGLVQHLLVIGLPDTAGFDFGWDPLDLDIVFLILSIVFLAISQVMQRAWEAEEENKLFL